MRQGAWLCVLLAGCAAPARYQGIDLRPGMAAPELRLLAARALSGDKRARLDLGIRFEEGRGVARDPNRARRLYRLAAAPSGGTIFLYRPPVRRGDAGAVVPIDTGPVSPGLTEARERLVRLDAER